MKTLIQALLPKRPLADLQLEITILCSGFRMGLMTFYDNGTFSASCRLYINALIYFWNKDLEINMVLFIICCSTLVANFFFYLQWQPIKALHCSSKPHSTETAYRLL